MNNISLVGRLGQDPESGTTPGGLPFAKFSLAVDRGRKDGDGVKVTDWFTVKAFGKTAEVVSAYAKKGRQVGVVGAMQNERWTDREGAKRDSWCVMAERVTFLDAQATENLSVESGDRIPF